MSSHGPDPASGRRHTTALLELAHVLDRALDPDTVARRVAESVLTLCEARSVGLYRLEPESGDLIGIAFAGDRGQDIPVIKAGTGTAGLALREGCPVTTSDPLSDPRIILTPQIRARFEQTGSRSVLAVPLRAKERLIGALTVRNRPGYVFDDAEVLLVQTFADLSALVLETARLFEASERQRRIAETLARMGRLLAQQLDVDLVMQRIAEGALTVFDALAANVQLIEPGSGDRAVAAVAGSSVWRPGETEPANSGLSGLAMSTRRPVTSSNILEDPRITYSARVRERVAAAAHRAAIAVPLIFADEVVGIVLVADREGRVFGPDDVGLAEALADQAAVAIANARLLASSERRRGEAEALARSARTLTESLDVNQVGVRIVETVRPLFRAHAATLRLLGPDGALVKIAGTGVMDVFPPGHVAPPGQGAMGRAVVEGHPVSSSDVANDPRLIFSVERQRQLADSQGARSVLAVPLRAKTVIIGGLLVGDEVGREFSGAEMSLLQAFADQAALALDNARLYEEAARRRREAETLVRIAGTLTESLDSSALGEHIVQSVLELLGARTATLRLLEADGSLRAIAIGGAMRTQLTPGHVLPSGIGIVALAISKGGPVSTRDELTDPRIRLNDELRRASSRTGTSALVAVPLRVKGRTIGTLNVGDAAGRAFSEPEIALLQAFADQAALAVDNARLYEDALDAYRQLSETQAQLVQAQKMEAVGQLTGGVAHDFNNLLTVILGNLGYVDERHPELETWVKPAIAAAERGAELTQRLLAFARRQMLHPRVIDVNRLMDGVGVLLRRTLSETIALESVRAAGLWSAEADPGQLENALLNLALNARDAMPDGGTLTIETANAYFDDAYAAANPETSPGQYVMIGVTDTGTGMEPDVVQRAFEPFFTTKGVGKGSGLGLSMVYGFARQSGGHVKIYSEVGQGTTVRLYLPRARGAEPGPEKQPAAPSVSTGHERILVVEDDAHVRTTVGGLLTSLGYRVVAAATAQDALARLEDPEPIDLLFTDVVLPGGANGAQLAEAARARRPGLKVLFTSGYTANAVGHQGRLDEGVQLLSKPYRKEELARKIRQVLDAPS